MIETITVFGFVGEDVVEVDTTDIANDWLLAIHVAQEKTTVRFRDSEGKFAKDGKLAIIGPRLKFKPDGERRT